MNPVKSIQKVLLFAALILIHSQVNASSNADMFTVVEKFFASDASPLGSFGYALDMDGSTAVVGSYRENSPVYVFAHQGDRWVETATLNPDDRFPYDNFGWSVAISGSTAVVGTPLHRLNNVNAAGAAYVFEYNAGSWTQAAKLIPPAVTGGFFGQAVSISRDWIAVGALNTGTYMAGEVYLYERNTGGADQWGQVARLTSSSPSRFDDFGASVSIDENTLIVGARGTHKAYIFEYGTGTWTQTAELAASDGMNGSYGASVALSGNTAVVGAPYMTVDGITQAGAAYIYEDETAWEQVARLTAEIPTEFSQFGTVSITDNLILVGERGYEASFGEMGTVYAFERNTGGANAWGQVKQFTAADASESHYFGHTLATSGTTALVGTPFDRDYGDSAGAVYQLNLQIDTTPPTVTNINTVSDTGDGILSEDEITEANITQMLVTFSEDVQFADQTPNFLLFADGNDSDFDTVSCAGGIAGDDLPISIQNAAYNSGTHITTLSINNGSPLPADRYRLLVCGTTSVEDLAGNKLDGDGNGTGGDDFLRNFNVTNTPTTETQKLVFDDSRIGYGYSVDIDGSRAVVGAMTELDLSHSLIIPGAAYILEYQGNAWVETAVLSTSNVSDNFGWDVALDGNRVLVSAPHAQRTDGVITGQAYIYEYQSGNWELTQTLFPPDGIAGNNFGIGVDLDGDRAIVSTDVGGSGAVYVFEYEAGTWNQTAKIFSSNTEVKEFYSTLTLDNDRLLIRGSYRQEDVWRYAAYIFDYNNTTTTWNETAVLMASDGNESDNFGYALSLADNRAVIGAWGHIYLPSGYDTGAAYIFEDTGSGWNETAKLIPSDGENYQGSIYFGQSTSLWGDSIWVGAGSANRVYRFDYIGGRWQETAILAPSIVNLSQIFGASVAVSGSFVFVGAPTWSEDSHALIGAVYTYQLAPASDTLPPVVTNINTVSDTGDGILSEDEITEANITQILVTFSEDVQFADQTSNFLLFADGNDSDFDTVSCAGGIAGDDLPISIQNAAYNSGTHVTTLSINNGSPLPADRYRLLVCGTTSVQDTAGNKLDGDGNGTGGDDFLRNFRVSNPPITETQKLFASDGIAYANFGGAVDMDGGRAVIGASGQDVHGVAYIYEYTSAGWVNTAKLMVDTPEEISGFGRTVAIEGNRVLVGASRAQNSVGEYRGLVYLFEYNAGTWNQVAVLQPNDGAKKGFGGAVAVEGNRILVGARAYDGTGRYTGEVYVFEYTSGAWTQTAKLTASEPVINSDFGCSIALDGNRILIGTCHDGSGFGAYIFDYNGSSWSQSAKLVGNDTVSGDYFGFDVALEGNRAIVGAFNSDALPISPNDSGKGSVYVFDYNGSTWNQSAKLTATNAVSNPGVPFWFGFGVDLLGDKLLVGAIGVNDFRGAAYLFEYQNGIWYETKQFVASHPLAYGDYLGVRLVLSESFAFVSATGQETSRGSTYVYQLAPASDTLPPVVTNINTVSDTGDGILSEDEITEANITQILVTFSEDVQFADQTSNFLLFADGNDSDFDTVSCAGGIAGDELPISIQNAAYNSGTHVTTLSINSGSPLPADRYRLLVCGTTSVQDTAGNKLDGDGNGTGGDDFLRNFRIEPFSTAILWIDSPPAETVLPDSFAINGWAVDPDAGNGNGLGVDLVRVYQGNTCDGTLLGEGVPNVARPDVAAAFGLDSSYINSGFSILLNGLPNGSLTFTTCVHSTVIDFLNARDTRTVTIQASQAVMSVDIPGAGANVSDAFAVVGWAVDPAAGNGNGPGINLVRVYQGTTCTGTILGEAAPAFARPDVAAAFGLDSSYTNSGFGITLSGLPGGTFTFTTCARSSLTNTFTAQVTRTVTIQASQAVMSVDIPGAGANVSDAFVVVGWAVDPAAGNGNGPGINLVRVYQGTTCTGTILGEAAPAFARPDVAAAFGLDSSYTNSGFGITLSGLPGGTFTFTTCARSTLTNTFTAQVTRTVTVQASQAVMFVDSPAAGATLSDNFAVTGWAVDPAVGSSNGPGVNLVRVYQGAACTGTMLGEVVPNVSRPDVAAAFGLDSSYNLNGYNIPLSGLSNGSLTFTVCARSSVTNTFTAQVTRSVTVQVSQTILSVDSPAEGAIIPPNFVIVGWALDPAAGNNHGPGINNVTIYRGTTCTGTALVSSSLYGSRPDVAAALGLDSSYNLSGFGVAFNLFPDGTLTFTVCARSSLTNTFTAQVTRTVTIPASQAAITLETPTQGSSQSGDFQISGWAVDPALGSGTGPGINRVRVFHGGECSGTILGESVLNIQRPDVVAALGLDNSFNLSGFSILLLGGSPGSAYTFTACAYSALTNTVEAQETRTVIMQEAIMAVDEPKADAVLTNTSFTVNGWSVRPSAGVGNGPGINLVRVYEGESCSGTILGQAPPSYPASNVLLRYGLDSSYLINYFVVPVNDVPLGTLTFTVCARSTTNTYVSWQTRTITIERGFMALGTPVHQSIHYTDAVVVNGWAYREAGAGNGPGIDLVRVYTQGTCTGTILGESILDIERPDVMNAFGLDSSYLVSGFEISLTSLPVGSTSFTVCGRSSATNTWIIWQSRTVQHYPTYMTVETPVEGAILDTNSTVVTGWTVSLRGNNNGPGINLVRAYQGNSCSGTVLGEGTLTISRPDVADALSLDLSYTVSGFSIPISSLPAGAYTFTVCGHSSATNGWAIQATRTVTVDSGFAAAAGTEARIEAEDEAQMVQMGNWTRHESVVASGEAYLYSSGTGEDSLTLSFTGSQIDIIYVQHPSLGKLAVEIDGVIQQVINLSGIENFGEEMLISDLPAGDHHLRLIALEGMVAVDAVVIPDAAP